MRNMLSQRRRHSRWRMFVVLLIFVGLIRHSELAPANMPESSSSMPKRKSQDIGSLSDFTWQAWLLVDAQTGLQPGMESTTLLRRITPKSVFIAPALPACADGYRADNMNRCVKSVNIDENAHFSFLLQRLNALYANQGNSQASNGPKNERKKSTGPLQLNIPLIANTKPESTKVELAVNDPIAILPDESHLNKMTKPHETMVTLYEVKNDTTLDDEREEDEEETTSFLENSNVSDVIKADQKPDAVVPVAEFVEEMNDTSFSGVVDYKIPIDLKTLLNTSSLKRLNVTTDIGRENGPTTGRREDSTEMSPKLVLLLSPTKAPGAMPNLEMDDLPLVQNDTANDHAIMQVSNLTSNSTEKGIVDDSVSDYHEFPPTWKLSETPPMDKHRENETKRVEDDVENLGPEGSKLNDSHEAEFVYDEEDDEDEEYSYNRDLPEDDSTEMENEEILKHGEAGMTIPTRNIERLHRRRPQQEQQQQEQQQQEQQQKQNRTTEESKQPSDTHDQIVIRFNESTPVDKDEAGSIVSSEVSIDGDLILETTLLDVNTERLQTTTIKSPSTSTREATTSNDSNDSTGLFDQNQNTAPEVVLSSQDAHGTTSTSLQGHKRVDVENLDSTQLETDTGNKDNEEPKNGPSSSESFFYDPPEEDSITETHTIDDEQSDITESVPMENSRDSDDAIRFFESVDVPASFEQTSMDLGPAEDFVRFPTDYARQPSQGYVRFPGNEANSIHSQSYKQHHPTDDGAPYGSTSTKSSVPVRQKSAYHLTVPGWKSDRAEQFDRASSTIAAALNRQKQRPELLRFWSKMPIRDPDIDTLASESVVQPRDRSHRRSRVTSSFAETSPQSINRTTLTRERRRAPIRD